jgi:hypothetical protein
MGYQNSLSLLEAGERDICRSESSSDLVRDNSRQQLKISRPNRSEDNECMNNIMLDDDGD